MSPNNLLQSVSILNAKKMIKFNIFYLYNCQSSKRGDYQPFFLIHGRLVEKLKL